MNIYNVYPNRKYRNPSPSFFLYYIIIISAGKAPDALPYSDHNCHLGSILNTPDSFLVLKGES